MDDLRQSLRTALVSQFRVNQARLKDHTGLFSESLIDSLSVMELVSFVEREIGQRVPAAEITLENFDSIDRIVRFAQTLAAATDSR